MARAADLEKAKVDVDVAGASLDVAKANEKRVEALFGYTKLLAPYDGIVVLRNVNTGDFVLPATGDPSAAIALGRPVAGQGLANLRRCADGHRACLRRRARAGRELHRQRSGEAGRRSANVTKGNVLVSAYKTTEIPGHVTRSSWALNFTSRTLRAEIDLHNPDSRLLPGMYAYGRVVFDKKNATVLPTATVTEIGNQVSCYLYTDGKAVVTPIETGVRAGEWIEVLQKQVDGKWSAFDGKEDVILGDMSELADGQPVILDQ